ncbi:MAG: glycosyltransferase family protein [bacterium]|nr:glycosyltransferase family protein [bacterium]
MYNGRTERIVATLEARMTSTRLPGKVLMPLVGKPVLWHIIERLKRSAYLDAICLATTTNAQDDVLEKLARELGVEVFRGSEQDVLGRILGAAQSVGAEVIVEISGDCPAIDHRSVDECLEEFFKHDVDYVANNLNPTYPTGGFEVQVFKTSLLAGVAAHTQDPTDRAHVTYYIYTHPEHYHMRNVLAPKEATAPWLRVVLDEVVDYQVISAIFEALYPKNPDFSAEDVVRFLQAHPDIATMNKNVRRKKPDEL